MFCRIALIPTQPDAFLRLSIAGHDQRAFARLAKRTRSATRAPTWPCLLRLRRPLRGCLKILIQITNKLFSSSTISPASISDCSMASFSARAATRATLPVGCADGDRHGAGQTQHTLDRVKPVHHLGRVLLVDHPIRRPAANPLMFSKAASSVPRKSQSSERIALALANL